MGEPSSSEQKIWHPFTQMARFDADPQVVVASGEGNHLIGTDGKRYVDAVSSMWAIVHGHSHPHIVEAIQRQAATLQHSTLLGATHSVAEELANRLSKHLPPELSRFFFSGDGASAVEVALKMAIQYWANKGQPEKQLIVSLDMAYHGDTAGAVSVGGVGRFRDSYGPLLFEPLRIPNPYAYRCDLCASECTLACLDPIEELLKTRGHEIAAVIVEPRVQAAAGMIVAPEGHLARVAQSCARHGVLLIADEIATGFGKTGAMFACDLEWVTPDIMTIGKGMTGGYLPMSATIAKDEIYQAFYDQTYGSASTLYHGHTFAGNPICAAAAIANLDVFEESPVLERVLERSSFLRTLLQENFGGHPLVGDIRQQGLMAGIELVRDASNKTPFDSSEGIGARVSLAARDRGVLLRPLGDVLVVMPPLSIEEDQLIQIVDSIGYGLDKVAKELGGPKSGH
ncbi:MAG: adenosylmethionine-8-amino-7-oxononanoate aminotransferase [Chloroflexi bacterium]|nr:MAG: adenosylmethionine-8-amino-7-oxononanoate aminotransferase [Chloroflexota bacterium]